jgi:glyoxylase-like metal-dependent hydrolase (beta-lactamase superfamily II)
LISTWKIGDITVTGLVEYFGPTHDPRVLFPAFEPSALEQNRDWLVPDYWYPHMDRLVVAIQFWIVHAGNNVILVDTGFGNSKTRATARANHLNTLVPVWLEAAKARPDQVTHVVQTHLHSDHVGWNTSLEGGRWVPTFPNARYYMPLHDFRFFKDFNETGKARDGGSFYDSVMPVVGAGLVEFIDAQTEIADCLRVVPAFGHSPGQLNYWIESQGQRAVFCGDVLHHPIQIAQPEWNTVVDILPDDARRTRGEFLAKAADSDALVMPGHFGKPHAGYIRRQGGGYRFEPAPADH